MSTEAEVIVPQVNYFNVAYGVKSWLLTKDHKRIALLYLAHALFVCIVLFNTHNKEEFS